MKPFVVNIVEEIFTVSESKLWLRSCWQDRMFRSHWYDKARKSEEQEAVESSGEMVEEQFVVAHKEQMVSTPQTLPER